MAVSWPESGRHLWGWARRSRWPKGGMLSSSLHPHGIRGSWCSGLQWAVLTLPGQEATPERTLGGMCPFSWGQTPSLPDRGRRRPGRVCAQVSRDCASSRVPKAPGSEAALAPSSRPCCARHLWELTAPGPRALSPPRPPTLLQALFCLPAVLKLAKTEQLYFPRFQGSHRLPAESGGAGGAPLFFRHPCQAFASPLPLVLGLSVLEGPLGAGHPVPLPLKGARF